MKTILAADIGGTNSRFGRFEVSGNTLEFKDSIWLSTKDAASFNDLIKAFDESDFPLKIADCDAAVIAVPGAVKGQTYAKPPNIPWDIDVSHANRDFGVRSFYLINDFVSQAYACRTQAVAGARLIKDGVIQDDRPLAVIGAGTGLGQSCLMPVEHAGFIAVPSEAGHASFGFVGDEENEYEAFVLKKTGHPYPFGDFIVTGYGLSLLHEFLTGDSLSPAEVAATFTEDSQTLAMFARFYGRACRNYALCVVALGGVYIAGGLAAKNPSMLTHPEFTREFVNSPTYGFMLEDIPIYLNTNEESGLWGAAFFGQLKVSTFSPIMPA